MQRESSVGVHARLMLNRLSGIGTVIAARWFGSGIQFALNIVLGRALGPTGLGLYYLFYAWARFLGQIGGLGLSSYALRTVSVMKARDKTPEARAFLIRSLYLVLSTGGLLLLIALPFTNQLAPLLLGTHVAGHIFMLAIVVGVLFAVLTLGTEVLKALQQAGLALTLEFSAFPLLLIVAVTAVIPFIQPVPVLYALIATVGAVFATVLFTFWLLQRQLPAIAAKTQHRFQIRSLITFWSFGLLGTLMANLPFLLLPHFATAKEIGEFGVAYRLVALSGTVLAALASRFGPQFAQHYAQGNVKQLQADFNRSQLYSTLVFTPLLIGMVLFAKPLLSVFGQQFASTGAVLFLQIMAVGQFINSSTGLTAQYLNMVHREVLMSWILLAAVAFMLVSAAVLGGRYGAIGVAIAYSGTLALQNLTAFFAIKCIMIQLKKQPDTKKVACL